MIETNYGHPAGHYNNRNILGSHSGIRGESLQKPPMVPNSKVIVKRELDKDDIEAEFLNE